MPSLPRVQTGQKELQHFCTHSEGRDLAGPMNPCAHSSQVSQQPSACPHGGSYTMESCLPPGDEARTHRAILVSSNKLAERFQACRKTHSPFLSTDTPKGAELN